MGVSEKEYLTKVPEELKNDPVLAGRMKSFIMGAQNDPLRLSNVLRHSRDTVVRHSVIPGVTSQLWSGNKIAV